jgi:hypothetical protein
MMTPTSTISMIEITDTCGHGAENGVTRRILSPETLRPTPASL